MQAPLYLHWSQQFTKKPFWFIEGQLAGIGYPKETDIPFLVQNGITTLVNMTRDQYYTEVADANNVTVHEIYIR